MFYNHDSIYEGAVKPLQKMSDQTGLDRTKPHRSTKWKKCLSETH